MTATGFRFSSEERLRSRNLLEQIVRGKKLYHGLIRLSHIPLPPGISSYPAQVAFSVPKRTFKKAHVRNRIRRRMREAYRLAKPAFYEELSRLGMQCAILFVYSGKEEESYERISEVINSLLSRILTNVQKPN